MKIQYVAQKDECGCAVACISMVTGIPYDRVAKDFHNDFKRDGMKPEHTANYVSEHGFTAVEVVARGYYDVPAVNKRIGKPFADIHIITVQARADSEQNHAIVMDKRGRIFDPANRNRKDLTHYYCVIRVLGFWKK